MSTPTEFFVYMLQCRDGSYYIGHTDNIEARMTAHHRGEFPGYTAGRRPVQLVWLATCESRQEAFERERQVKGWSRAKKEALIRNDWHLLPELSRARARSGPASAHPEPVEGRADG